MSVADPVAPAPAPPPAPTRVRVSALRAWQDENLLQYLRRLLVTIAVVGIVFILVLLRDVLLLAFAALLVSVALRAIGAFLSRVLHVGPRIGLALACVIGVVVIGSAFAFFWPPFQAQLPTLFDRITAALGDLEDTLGIQLPDTAQELSQNLTGLADQVLSSIVSVVGTLATAISAFLLVLVAGVFIAAEPTRYRDGIVMLFPKNWHDNVQRAFDKAGEVLVLWLRAQGLAMIAVGVFTGLGCWAIGLPSPFALGLIAAFGEFIPIIGPFAAAAPAILIAFDEGGTVLAWTIVLYITVQQLESNLLQPMLQRRIVMIPPVLLLFSLVALGLLFGIPGIIVAAPLTAAGYVLIREFYVGELLGEQELIATPPPEAVLPPAVQPADPAKRDKQEDARQKSVRRPARKRAASAKSKAGSKTEPPDAAQS